MNPTDIYTTFRLPLLKDGPDGLLSDVAATVQVAMRARALGWNGESPIDCWSAAQALLPNLTVFTPGAAAPAFVFTGRTASGLNQAIADSANARVRVRVPSLTVDQPILIHRKNLLLDLGSTQLVSANPDPYFIRIQGASNITLENGRLTSGNSGVLVTASTYVTLGHLRIDGLTGDGIVVTGSTGVIVSQNEISGISGTPVILHGGTSSSAVRDNDIRANLGPSNMMAGIVLSDHDVDLTTNPFALLGPDRYWVVTQPITGLLNPPHDNVILSNRVTNNLSSGIYVDGAVRNVIAYNFISGNSKEGLCLDNGSTANVVTGNIIQQNGQRWGESDQVMAEDGILDGGRLPDGTPAEKVPGISLDNAIYNIVFTNEVWNNYGGGVKIVRTGYFNSIGMNTIYNNNLGEGPGFHFFGIELGAAGGNPPSPDLDFTPSRGNIVFNNSIRGDHYSGIFFDGGSDLNDVFDNVIEDAEAWALESDAVMQNNALNNLTNIPSRNITAGLDPSLLNFLVSAFLPPGP